jgi:hypothetical protein
VALLNEPQVDYNHNCVDLGVLADDRDSLCQNSIVKSVPVTPSGAVGHPDVGRRHNEYVTPRPTNRFDGLTPERAATPDALKTR